MVIELVSGLQRTYVAAVGEADSKAMPVAKWSSYRTDGTNRLRAPSQRLAPHFAGQPKGMATQQLLGSLAVVACLAAVGAMVYFGGGVEAGLAQLTKLASLRQAAGETDAAVQALQQAETLVTNCVASPECAISNPDLRIDQLRLGQIMLLVEAGEIDRAVAVVPNTPEANPLWQLIAVGVKAEYQQTEWGEAVVMAPVIVQKVAAYLNASPTASSREFNEWLQASARAVLPHMPLPKRMAGLTTIISGYELMEQQILERLGPDNAAPGNGPVPQPGTKL